MALIKKGEDFPSNKGSKVLNRKTGANHSNLKLYFDIPWLQSLWSDRNLLLMTGLLLALASLYLFNQLVG
ncbi:MAG: hypothetical protein CMC18_02410 [Flavobacteriaceae bacterium]|nr:hypothetical protein [Flavobacteriaceae bacterium]